MQISDDDDDSISMRSHRSAAQQRSRKPHSPKATTFQSTTSSPFSPKNVRAKSRFDIDDRPSSPPLSSQSTAYPTPSPSPPLPTSPPALPLIDNIAQQRFPSTDILRTISTTYAPPPPQSRREMLDGGRGSKGRGRGGGMARGMGKVEAGAGGVATKG